MIIFEMGLCIWFSLKKKKQQNIPCQWPKAIFMITNFGFFFISFHHSLNNRHGIICKCIINNAIHTIGGKNMYAFIEWWRTFQLPIMPKREIYTTTSSQIPYQRMRFNIQMSYMRSKLQTEAITYAAYQIEASKKN